MKPNKMASQFSTRRSDGDYSAVDRSNVVYSSNFNEKYCNTSYFGYTTKKLSTRRKQHRDSQSGIYKHFTIDHTRPPPTYASPKDMFKVKYRNSDTRSVELVECMSFVV